jgi:ABC-type uncharacterized transport system involved in gliding motility auxiliary subunit
MAGFASLKGISSARLLGAALTAAGVAVIAMLFVLSQMYVLHFDWTYLQRKTLSPGSQDMLAGLEGPVEITAFVRDNDLAGRQMIEVLVGRYQRFKADLQLEFVNPDREPGRVRELGITVPREMVVTYAGRSEQLKHGSEQALSNLLLRLARRGEQTIHFLSGHGERSITGAANYELGDFGRTLEQKGFRLQSLSLVTDPAPSAIEGLLVVASPNTELLTREIRFLMEYVALGGNLLWILDPDSPPSLEPLAESLGVAVLEGTVVDAGSRLYGIDDPAFAVVAQFPDHEITAGLGKVALFPRAVGFEVDEVDRWQATTLLATQEESWTESGEVTGRIQYDTGTSERPGPIIIGAALARSQPDSAAEQRVAVIGDGDFLSNSFLANGSNLDLGLRLLTWLSSGDARLAIEIRGAPDTQLQFSNSQLATLAIWFLLAQPLFTLGLGIAICWRRRRR